MQNRRRVLAYLACILLFSVVGSESVQGQVWEDDFESYTVGSAPTSNWHLSGNTSSIIVNDISFTGSKSLRTYGNIGGCWAGLLSRPLGTSFPLTIEMAVRNGSENLSGCHPYRGSVELKPGPNWQDVPGATPFRFKENGDFEVTWDPPYQSFPGYALNEWHHIRVELSTPGDGLLHARYWIDEDYLGEFTRTWGTWMSDLTHLMIGCQEGTAWFDDVKVGGLPLDVWQDGDGHLWVENAFYRWDVTHGSSLIIKEGETWRDWRSVYNQNYYLVLGRNTPGTGGTQGGHLEMSDLTVVNINNDGQVATVELTGTFSRENRQATLIFTFSANSGVVKVQGQITNVPATPNPAGLHTSFSLVPGGDVTGADDFYHYSGQAMESGFPYGSWVRIPKTSFLPVGQTDYAYITNYDKSHRQGFAMITELSKTTDFITDINYWIAQIWDTHHYLNWSNMGISPNVTGPFTLFFYFYETDPVVAYQPVEDLINSGTLDGVGEDILVYVTWDPSCSYPCCCYPMTFFDEGLAQVLGLDGHSVTLTDRVTTPVITSGLLANYDQFWFLSTAEDHNVVLSQSETGAIFQFRNQGGGLFVAADHAPHYTWTANQIASPLGVQFYGSVTHSPEWTCLAPTLDSHPVFTGVSDLVLGRNEGAMSVTSPADVIATYNGNNVTAILDDGLGRCVFDVSFVRIFDSQIITCDNAQYFRNIADWLQSGGEEPVEPGYFIHVTDIHINHEGGNEWWQSFIDSVNNIVGPKPRFVVATGDLVHWGWHTDDNDADQNWGALLEPLERSNGMFYLDTEHQIPVFFCPGNHDAKKHWFQYDPVQPTSFETYVDSIGPVRYPKTISDGRIALIALNSGVDKWAIGPTPFEPEGTGLFAADIELLQSQLPSYDDSWTKVLLMHHPYINPNGENSWMIGLVEYVNRDQTFWGQDLEIRPQFISSCIGNNVDIVLAGHVHDQVLDDFYIRGVDWNDIGIWNCDGQTWQQDDGTRFVVTDALNNYSFRTIEYDASGNITNVGPIEDLRCIVGFHITCNTNVHVYDNHGNHLGPNESGGVDYQIPWAYYAHGLLDFDSLGHQSTITDITLCFEDSTDYEIEIESESNEPVNIEIFSKLVNGPASKVKYLGIPMSEGSKATARVEGFAIDYSIQVIDPDGTDRTVYVSEWYGNQPPQIENPPSGPDTVFVDSSSTFNAVVIDPDDDPIYYMFDWGDASSGDWIGPVNSGEIYSASQEWDTPGTFAVKVRAKDIWNHLGYWSGELHVCVLPNVGGLSGYVTETGGGLTGVPVDVVDWNGQLFAALVTNDSGFYEISDVPNGQYTVSISTPLGYQADEETKGIEVRGLSYEVNFELTRLEVTPEQRSMGYWKHQVYVHLSGAGHAQETLTDMSSYMGLIAQHFNGNLANPISIFEVVQPATQTDSLETLKDLLTVNQDGTMNDRAKQQLIALMLNVVSLKLHQTTPISDDSATVSQAITYCNQLITDPDSTNDEIAKDIADQINNGILVASEIIPLTTPEIIYKGTEDQIAQTPSRPKQFSLEQNYPNPFNPICEIAYALPTDCKVTLTIYNLLGQKVRVLVDEYQSAGNESVKWDGKDDQGQEVTSGVYFYRIKAGDFTQSKKMVILK